MPYDDDEKEKKILFFSFFSFIILLTAVIGFFLSKFEKNKNEDPEEFLFYHEVEEISEESEEDKLFFRDLKIFFVVLIISFIIVYFSEFLSPIYRANCKYYKNEDSLEFKTPQEISIFQKTAYVYGETFLQAQEYYYMNAFPLEQLSYEEEKARIENEKKTQNLIDSKRFLLRVKDIKIFRSPEESERFLEEYKVQIHRMQREMNFFENCNNFAFDENDKNHNRTFKSLPEDKQKKIRKSWHPNVFQIQELWGDKKATFFNSKNFIAYFLSFFYFLFFFNFFYLFFYSLRNGLENLFKKFENQEEEEKEEENIFLFLLEKAFQLISLQNFEGFLKLIPISGYLLVLILSGDLFFSFEGEFSEEYLPVFYHEGKTLVNFGKKEIKDVLNNKIITLFPPAHAIRKKLLNE